MSTGRRRAPRVAALMLVLSATGGCASGSMGAAPTSSPVRGSVVYYEFPNDRDKTRLLPASEEAPRGVDINSRLDIRVDPATLREKLSPRDAETDLAIRKRKLNERLASLVSSVSGVSDAVEQSRRAADVFRQGERTGDFSGFRAVLRVAAEQVSSVIDPLHDAIQARLAADPEVGATGAKQKADEQIAKLMVQETGTPAGYDWDGVRTLLAQEIGAIRAEIAILPADPGLQVEVRAYRISARDGSAVPIALPGYNQVQTGPVVTYEKVQVYISEDQRRLYQQFDSLAHTLAATQSLGDAVVTATRADYGLVSRDLVSSLATTAATLRESRQSLDALIRSTDGEKLRSWWSSVREGLPDSRANRAQADVEAVAAMVGDVRKDVQNLDQLASLVPRLRTASPDEAMTLLLGALGGMTRGMSGEAVQLHGLRPEVWRTRAAKLRELLSALQELQTLDPAIRERLRDPAGPWDELDQAVAAIEKLRDAASATSGVAIAWLQRVLAIAPAVAARDLPTPQGPRRVDVGVDASTSLDLRTIAAGREQNDLVRIEYRFFRDGKPIAGGWSDEFRIRSYGWNARAVASLGFTASSLNGVYRPTPALSWMARYRPWPGGAERGLADPWYSGIGVGLSTMALDTDPDETVELGIAATAGLLGDRILVGYGYNLQSKNDRSFLFFSLRLFSASGSLDVHP